MRTLKQHVDSIKHAMHAGNSATKETEIIQATNISAGTIAGLFPIGQLMNKITVSSGDRLPANLAGIVMVRDSSDNSQLHRRGEAAVWDDEEVNRFYTEIDRAAFSAVDLPFRSTGSIEAGSSKLECTDLIALAEGIFLYLFQVGDTAYQTTVDAEGNLNVDAGGNVILRTVPSSAFTPSLTGVRFYDSGTTHNNEIVYYGENEELAYWYDTTLGWVLTYMADVGPDPSGYFSFDDEEGTGHGDFANLYITFGAIYEHDAETVDDADFTDFVVCVSNDTYGDFYHGISAVNDDFTFSLDGTHPLEEEDSTITIFTERSSRIYFVDYSESELTSGTYDVYYWMAPNPMTQDEDIIPFAYPDYLELMTVRRLPETKDRRPVSKTELEEARLMAKKKEPAQRPPTTPKTRQGSVFQMGSMASDTYGERGA